MSRQNFRRASPSTSAEDVEMQLLAFPCFPSLPLWLQDCPLHSLPIIALQVFMFSGNTKGHSSTKSVGMEWFEYAPEVFRNGLRRSAFSHLPNAYGDIYISHFSSSAQMARSFCRRSPGRSTGTPHRTHSQSISGGRRAFIVSLSPLVERKWSIWSLGLKIKVS